MKNKTIIGFMKELTAFGGLPFYLFITALTINTPILTYNLIFGLIFSYLITIIIRLLYFKPRPNQEKHSNIIEKIDASSFPSLHSYRISMLTTFIYFNYGHLSTLLFINLSLVVFSTRYLLKRHFMIDIISGASLGYLTALILSFI